MSTSPPLLLVGHGTRSDAGVAEFTRFVGQVRARTWGRVPAVDGGFIELARPSVADAVARLVEPAAGGPRPIVAVPLVLTAAGHGKGDIPAALADLMARGPAPALVIGLPVGFVGAVEAKQALRDSGLPAVTNISEKGGAAVAAAALNALIYGDPLEEVDE